MKQGKGDSHQLSKLTRNKSNLSPKTLSSKALSRTLSFARVSVALMIFFTTKSKFLVKNFYKFKANYDKNVISSSVSFLKNFVALPPKICN